MCVATVAAVASIAAAGTGIGTAIENSGTASQGAQTNDQIAQQELANKQKIFQQLQPFFAQYLQQGSPFLQNIQAAAAGQNAQQYSNAAGNLRQTMQTSGMGYGPSGTTAAALGQLGTQSAQSASSNYLQNLLNNEQVKFQAAQGLTGIGNMMSNQNVVGQTPQPVNSQVGSSVNAFGQVLNNLPNSNQPNVPFGTPTPQSPQGVGVTTGPNPPAPPFYDPEAFGTQGTQV